MTSLSSISTNPLLQTLQAQGISSNKANLVEQDLEASIKQVAGSGGGKPDFAAVRSVLDQKISADVASGKLTQADADKINASLDSMATHAKGDAAGAQVASGAKSAHHGGGGGGGGGGGDSKTEVSSTTTVSGGMATTTITYSDGSTVTTTTVATSDEVAEAEPASAAEQLKASEDSAKREATQLAAQASYSEKNLDPGSLFDAVA